MKKQEYAQHQIGTIGQLVQPRVELDSKREEDSSETPWDERSVPKPSQVKTTIKIKISGFCPTLFEALG